MIPFVDSLEEAITHVTDPAIKEELEYQYDKHKELINKGLELASLQDDYDDLKRDYQNLQDEYDAVEERADQYESDADSYDTLSSILHEVSGLKINIKKAQKIFNDLFEAAGYTPCRIIDGSEPDPEDELPF